MPNASGNSWELTGLDRLPRGVDLLHDPLKNQGTAFSQKERDALGLQGLLPPRIMSQDTQKLRIMENFAHKPNDLEKYVFLIDLEDRNETLFYRVIMDNLESMMPIIYTPTVGKACQLYGHLFRRPRGLFISAEHQGRIEEVLCNWPNRDVRVIVVTDGERILGLGDLGANGMGIPVGKVTLYTACGGIHPGATLPVMMDVGTDNVQLLNDPLYIGLPQHRLRGEPYDELMDEFISAVQNRFPNALIQFEDFANVNAFRLLSKYRDRACVFNDDIQGTAAVGLAGLYSAMKITKTRLKDQKILFCGAGEAGIGIASLAVTAMMDEGLAMEDAYHHCWFFDVDGLIVQGRANLADYHIPFAHPHPPINCFLDAVEEIRPNVIIGASGHSRLFTRPIVELMANINERPVIFALSNPTSKAECTVEEAYTWSQGRAIFASGSPFEPVIHNGRTFIPSQINNAYVFPGVGLGVVLSGSQHVTDQMFLAAAKILANQVNQREMDQGQLFPPIAKIRSVSAAIAVAVIQLAQEQGLARNPVPENLLEYVEQKMYVPNYKRYA
ncbi:MAG: NAD-dependent malic enzyme [Pirellulales bacterium]|nr:NAD-dependent malic enzyme [Pirellulales bacterium]